MTDVASTVLLLVAAGLAWWQPLRVYSCAAAGAGLARCTVADRVIALVPAGESRIGGIAEALFGASVERTRSRPGTETAPAGGVQREISTRVEELTLLDTSGEVLWSASERHLVGASLEAIAEGIEVLRGDSSAAPWVLWQVPWPPFLIGSLFAVLGVSHLSVRLGLGLIGRGLLPRSLYQAVYWGPTLLAVAFLAGVWLVALAGGGPPSWLGALLRPAS